MINAAKFILVSLATPKQVISPHAQADAMFDGLPQREVANIVFLPRSVVGNDDEKRLTAMDVVEGSADQLLLHHQFAKQSSLPR